MKKFVIVTASILGVAGLGAIGAAVAADLPVRQPAPPPAVAPVVGKMPIGKAPIGKFPVGKAPAVVQPPPAPPLITRG
jgi:hypothetical protein